MNEAFCFRKIEANRNRPVHFEAFAGLNGKAVFVQVEQFTEVDNQAALRRVEAGVNRSVEFLANTVAPLSAGKAQHLDPPMYEYSDP